MDVSPTALGYLLGLLGVGVVSLVVGLRLGARSQAAPPPSEAEQLSAAVALLRRYFEKKALADLEASGAQLWSPDPDRVADLSYGLVRDASVAVGRNVKTEPQSPGRQ